MPFGIQWLGNSYYIDKIFNLFNTSRLFHYLAPFYLRLIGIMLVVLMLGPNRQALKHFSTWFAQLDCNLHIIGILFFANAYPNSCFLNGGHCCFQSINIDS